MAQNITPRQVLISDIKLQLGGGQIGLDLNPEHFDFAVRAAFERYRQRSSNAMEESFLFLDVQPDVSNYTLPDEVQEMRSVYRRNIGGSGTGTGAAVDPFSLAFTNNLYMIQNPGGMGGSGSGSLATYDFAMQFQSLVGRMFGREIMYSWDTSTKIIKFHRKFTAVEQIALHVYNARPESVLLNDVYARPWLRNWAAAECKEMMGQIRSKFGNIAGPQGGISLNGEALKTEAIADKERLDNDITQFVDSHVGYGFVIG